jgi:hypothetical protein
VNVAVLVASSYATLPGIDDPDGACSRNVALVTVLALSGSVNVAVTFVEMLTPERSAGGEVADTVGGVVSGPILETYTTSTQ